MKLLLSELLQPTLHNLWTSHRITEQIHFVCYQELQCQSLACIVLTCCLQKRENDQQISACIQPEEWSSHSEMVSSVGCWMSLTTRDIQSKWYPIKMILHQHAEGVFLMVADPFPNNHRSEFTWKSLKIPVKNPIPPVCRWPAIGQRLLRLVCRMMTEWFITGSIFSMVFFIIPIKLGRIIIEIPIKL